MIAAQVRAGGTHCFDDVVNQLLRLVDLFLSVCHNETVQILFLIAGMGSVGASLALLDGTLATDGDLGTRITLHFLESVSTRSDE